MKRFVLMLAFFFLLLTRVWAIELTLQDCLTMALKNNSGLKAVEEEAVSSQQEVNMALAEFFPSLGLESNYLFRNESDQFIFDHSAFAPGIPPGSIEYSVDNQNTYGLSLVFEQPLFTGGCLSHSFSRSKIERERALHEIERQRKWLAFRVKDTYYTLLGEQRCREMLEKVINTKKVRLNIMREQHNEGYIQSEDILQAETDLAFTKIDLRKSRDREALAQSRLTQLISCSAHDEISLSGEPVNGVLTISLEEAKEAALLHREEYKISLLGIETAEESVAIARSRFYPKASLTGRYTLQSETRVSRPQVWTLMAQINWSLFEWGKTRSELIKAEVMGKKAIHNHEELRQSIMIEVEEVWRTAKEAEELVRAHEKKLKTAEYRWGLVMGRYSEGEVKLVDLIEMETEMARSYAEYIGAITSLDSGLAHLEASLSTFRSEWFTMEESYHPDYEPDVIRPEDEP
jgi:outer membrane protein